MSLQSRFLILCSFFIFELIIFSQSTTCGQPGEPHDAHIINLSKSEKRVLKFPENTIMVYSCQNADDILLPNDGKRYERTFEKFLYERICSKGKWTRSLPSCGE